MKMSDFHMPGHTHIPRNSDAKIWVDAGHGSAPASGLARRTKFSQNSTGDCPAPPASGIAGLNFMSDAYIGNIEYYWRLSGAG